MSTQRIPQFLRGGIQVTMLPISAGDATLIDWADGHSRHSILIDSGLRENEAISYLQSIGVFHLDLIILSHPDLDHLGGLLSIVKSQSMSVDRIWCFDLNFLREFVTTGMIPPPRPGTREVLYNLLLRSTLDTFSDILVSANGRGIQTLQVSEGYRVSLGGLLLEVLYPPDTFYDALRNVEAAKRMLIDRRWPEEWENENGNRDGERLRARHLSRQERSERLTNMNIKPETPDDGFPLSGIDESEEAQDADQDYEQGKLPWKMVGTLYNNLSIVVKISVLGGLDPPSLLFPGDLTDWTTLVRRQWRNLKSDVLKMPHHGSENISFDPSACLCDCPFAPDCFHWHLFRNNWGRSSRCPLCLPQDRQSIQDMTKKSGSVYFLKEAVNPSQILIFPYPNHGLPNSLLARFTAEMIANREKRDSKSLASRTNVVTQARLFVGLERKDVYEVPLK